MSDVQNSVKGLFKELPHVFGLETYHLPQEWLSEFDTSFVNLSQLPEILEATPLNSQSQAYTISPIEVKLPSSISSLPRTVTCDRDLPLWPPIGACGFYLPFHYSISNWGVYLIGDRVTKLAIAIHSRAPNTSYEHCYVAATSFTYYHEAYNHKIEMLATRMELFSQKPVYTQDFEKYYQESFNRNEPNEETAANICAVIQTRKILEGLKVTKVVVTAIDNALLFYISKSPLHYSLASNFFLPYDKRKTVMNEWSAIEHRFFDNLAREHFGGIKLNSDTWGWGTALLTPRNKVNGKMTFIWTKGGAPRRLTTLTN
jgi:hypothetical protein